MDAVSPSGTASSENQGGDISAPEHETRTEPDMPAKEITILTAGRSGSGKSTLVSNLLEKEPEMILSTDTVTKQCKSYKVAKNNIEITILDTKGLESGREQKRKQLRGLAHTKEVNLIIYCLPVGPGSRFDDGNNREIMKALQDTYGKNVWSHCVLALTFSNIIQSMYSRDKYMKYINDFAAIFQKELENLGNSKVAVKTEFKDWMNQELESENNITIVAIPTELTPQENVLLDWKNMLFQEMIRKCPDDHRAALLQYQYGRREVIKILSSIVASATTVVGTGVGMVQGPVGAAIGFVTGAGVGAGVGVVLGGAVGAVMLAAKIDTKRKICDFFGVIDKIDVIDEQ